MKKQLGMAEAAYRNVKLGGRYSKGYNYACAMLHTYEPCLTIQEKTVQNVRETEREVLSDKFGCKSTGANPVG